MQVKFYNKDISFTPTMKENVRLKLESLDKFDDVVKFTTPAQVSISKNGKVKRLKIVVETTIKTVVSETSSTSFYDALDRNVDILKRQIRKLKNKRVDKPDETLRRGQPKDFKSKPLNERPIVVKEKYFFLDEIDVFEAIRLKEELGHSFFVYKDIELKKTCVLYTRKDGEYGLLITN